MQPKIADLEGLRLGQVAGTTVWIDVDAAGRGWFVDPTPGRGEEFLHARLPENDLRVARSSGSARRDAWTCSAP